MIYPVSQPSLGERERSELLKVFDSGRITHGRATQAFESALAEYLGVPHVVSCSSGTTALHLALATLRVGPGDEILVPDVTFIATANAVTYTGATPVLVDVDPVTWRMDWDDARSKVTKRTRAIVPVDLYGVPWFPDDPWELSRLQHLPVIEDAAEGLGGWRNGDALGTLGLMGTLSFYGNKVLTTGEGGAVVCREQRLADRLRLLRGQGMSSHHRYFHIDLGYNYRLTDLQAGIGIAQLSRLPEMLAQREAIMARYRDRLWYHCYAPCARPGIRHAPWLFTVTVHPSIDRDDLMARLSHAGIETRPTFVPLHRMPMYHGSDSDFPGACQLADHGLSLPTYADLSLADVDAICDVLLPLLKEMPR